MWSLIPNWCVTLRTNNDIASKVRLRKTTVSSKRFEILVYLIIENVPTDCIVNSALISRWFHKQRSALHAVHCCDSLRIYSSFFSSLLFHRPILHESIFSSRAWWWINCALRTLWNDYARFDKDVFLNLLLVLWEYGWMNKHYYLWIRFTWISFTLFEELLESWVNAMINNHMTTSKQRGNILGSGRWGLISSRRPKLYLIYGFFFTYK